MIMSAKLFCSLRLHKWRPVGVTALLLPVDQCLRCMRGRTVTPFGGTQIIPAKIMQERPKRYRKKPVVIEAMLWDGTDRSLNAIQSWAGTWDDGDDYERETFLWAKEQWPIPPTDVTGVVWDRLHSTWVGVKTGQYIIKGVQGEFYPCDPDVFEMTYEAVNDD